MTTRNVHEFCERLWVAREELRLPGAAVISRGLALAVAADVQADDDYEPHLDLRVAWAEAMVRGRRCQRPECRPEAPGAVEATAAYLLGKDFPMELDGKQRAAGEGNEDLFSSLSTTNPLSRHSREATPDQLSTSSR